MFNSSQFNNDTSGESFLSHLTFPGMNKRVDLSGDIFAQSFMIKKKNTGASWWQRQEEMLMQRGKKEDKILDEDRSQRSKRRRHKGMGDIFPLSFSIYDL